MYFIANWKMNPLTKKEAVAIATSTKKATRGFNRVKVLVAPPAIFIEHFAKTKSKSVIFGMQNIHEGETGSFTGEISALMAMHMGVQFAILGHSERRAMGERSEDVAKKALSCLEVGITPVICVGERTRDESGHFLKELALEVRTSLALIPKTKLKNVILAYEPIWAIGKSDEEALRGNDLFEMVVFLRKTLSEIGDRKIADEVSILYGGSVSSSTIEDIARGGRVNGVLVGRKSMYPDEVKKMLAVLNDIK